MNKKKYEYNVTEEFWPGQIRNVRIARVEIYNNDPRNNADPIDEFYISCHNEDYIKLLKFFKGLKTVEKIHINTDPCHINTDPGEER